MIIGRFVRDSEHLGRELLMEDHELAISGVGRSAFEPVADADARGQVEWEQQAFRTWVLNRATEAGWQPPVVEMRWLEEMPAEAPEPEPAVVVEPEPRTEPEPAAVLDEAVAAVGRALEKPTTKPAPRKPRAKKGEATAAPKREAAKKAEPVAAAEPAPQPERPAAPKRARAAKKPEPVAAAEPAPEPAPPKEEPPREREQRLSPRARVVLGVIATFVFAAMMAAALSRPIEKRPLPTPAVTETQEQATSE